VFCTPVVLQHTYSCIACTRSNVAYSRIVVGGGDCVASFFYFLDWHRLNVSDGDWMGRSLVHKENFHDNSFYKRRYERLIDWHLWQAEDASTAEVPHILQRFRYLPCLGLDDYHN
jgi:hypothetical protein